MKDDTICDKHPYGQHIALRCKKHPNLRWLTKNIIGIGSRSIFYLGHEDGSYEPDCDCSAAELEHVCEPLEGA